MLIRSLSAFVVILLQFPAYGGTLSLDGNFLQGGLIVGRTDLGTRVTLDNRDIKVGPKGIFVFGFRHDARDMSKLTVQFPDGRQIIRTLSIRQRTYLVEHINGLPPKMVTPRKADLRRINDEAQSIRAARAIFTAEANFYKGLIWPINGRITGVYGSRRVLNGKPRRPHLGIDIAAPVGTQVYASATGTVTLSKKNLYFTGGTLIIDHGHGLSTVYSHLAALGVRFGERVIQGQRIGTVGSTGRSTGPHLDWRVNWFQDRLDPSLIARRRSVE